MELKAQGGVAIEDCRNQRSRFVHFSRLGGLSLAQVLPGWYGVTSAGDPEEADAPVSRKRGQHLTATPGSALFWKHLAFASYVRDVDSCSAVEEGTEGLGERVSTKAQWMQYCGG